MGIDTGLVECNSLWGDWLGSFRKFIGVFDTISGIDSLPGMHKVQAKRGVPYV